MANPNGLSPHSAGGMGNSACRTDRSTGYLQRNSSGFGYSAPNNNQSTPHRDIDCGGKLQRFLAVFVTTADKNRNGQVQACPLPAFSRGGVASHVEFHPTTEDNCVNSAP